MALLSDIHAATGGQTACSLLQAPVRALRSAADSLDSMKNNPPAGVRQLADQLKGVELPRIEGVDAVADGIRGLRSALPEAGELTQPVADALGEFFGAIQDNLSGQLDGLLSSFSGLDTLANVGMSQPVDGTMASRLQALQDALVAVPDPLTVVTLLEWIQTGMERFPRGIFRSRYLPLVDELREKLQTTLRWNTLSGTELVAEVEQTLVALAGYVHRSFLTDGVETVSTPLLALSAGFDAARLDGALDGMLEAMGVLADAVTGGDLNGTEATIADLVQHRSDVEGILGALHAQAPAVAHVRSQLDGLPEELEDRALHFLSVIQPPHDLEVLGLALEPLGEVIANSGLNTVMDKLTEFVSSIRGVLDSLNISSLKDTFLQVLATAEEAVNGLREVLMRVTIEFSALMDRVRSAIQGLGIGSAVDAMENGLRNFIALVRQTADTVFSPVRNFLLGVFHTVNGFLDELDPSVVVQALKRVISTFTDLLSNPQLLNAIDSVKGALDTVNAELGGFTFKPGTDLVVQGIDVVEKALQIASSLPLPDSLKKELRAALNQLPRSLDPAVDVISDALDELVDEGPRPVLLQIKVGPGKLVDLVSAYAPEKLVKECLGSTYQDLLTEMERFTPSSLLVPIQQALDVVKTEVRRIADPSAALEPLQAPFDELLGLLDAFDPEELIAPLNDELQDGMQALIEVLPIGAANAIFDQVAGVALRIQSVSDALSAVHGFLDELRQRLGGLSNARQQAQDLGTAIAARVDQVSDISAVTAAMGLLGTALGDIHAGPLLARVDGAVQTLSAQFASTEAKQRLSQIAAAMQTFPVASLMGLPPSLNQTNVKAFLDEFDPLAAGIAAPVDMIDTLGSQLQASQGRLASYLHDWDERFLPPTGPILQLHRPTLTAAELQAMLRQSIEDQLMNTLDPVMRVVEYLQNGVDGVVAQVAALSQDLNEVLTDILEITDALEELRDATNELIETLLGLDLGFLADGFRTVFDTVRTELQAFSPAHIGEVLGRAFDDILAVLDLDELIGAAGLDAGYQEIVENLRRLDPGKILIETLQPEFEKVLSFLMRFDLSVQIDAFLSNIDRLKEELRAELTRVSDAYEGMWDAIPSSIGGVTGTATVSVTITAA